MLKLAAVLLVLMILFGVLGFVVHVAAAVTKARSSSAWWRWARRWR